MTRFNIHTYIFDMIKNTTVSKKLTSTLKVNHQLNQQSPRNSDSVY